MRVTGLMSGTSLDGIDAAYLELAPRGDAYDVAVLRFVTLPFAAPLRARLEAALPPNAPAPGEVAGLDRDLGAAFGEAACAAARGERIDLVASHGLTLFHDGAAGLSLQLGDAFAIRERAAATVAYDFRRADCAAGGHGAPLVPYVDALLFGDAPAATVALNVGGIANVTIVPARGAAEAVRGWDCGPGNILLDAFVRARTGGAKTYDAGGAFAAAGRPAPRLLEALLADRYFAQTPPKSTGREHFGLGFLAAHRELDELSLEDGCATLTALTAEAVARDVRGAVAGARVLVGGGGAHNRTLLGELAARLGPAYSVVASSAAGIDPDAKEAVAFAILGYELLRERAAGMPAVTGARRPALLGALAPHALGTLLARVRAESEAR